MQVCFCSFEDEIHALFLEKEWAEELVDVHTNHDGRVMISRVNIESSLAEELQAYINQLLGADVDTTCILRGILDLGFEAGEMDIPNGPILNDLLHLVEVDIEADIHISTLLALYEIARQEGATYKTRSEGQERQQRHKRSPRKRVSKKNRKKLKKEGKKKATRKGA